MCLSVLCVVVGTPCAHTKTLCAAFLDKEILEGCGRELIWGTIKCMCEDVKVDVFIIQTIQGRLTWLPLFPLFLNDLCKKLSSVLDISLVFSACTCGAAVSVSIDCTLFLKRLKLRCGNFCLLLSWCFVLLASSTWLSCHVVVGGVMNIRKDVRCKLCISVWQRQFYLNCGPTNFTINSLISSRMEPKRILYSNKTCTRYTM